MPCLFQMTSFKVIKSFSESVCICNVRPAADRVDTRGDQPAARADTAGLPAPWHPEEPGGLQVKRCSPLSYHVHSIGIGYLMCVYHKQSNMWGKKRYKIHGYECPKAHKNIVFQTEAGMQTGFSAEVSFMTSVWVTNVICPDPKRFFGVWGGGDIDVRRIES